MHPAIQVYLDEVSRQFYSGHAVEHAYRPALKSLIETFDEVLAVNDPKRSEHGAPDFAFLKKSNQKIILGYAEAKDITVRLDRTEQTNQMQRYAGYANLFLTDYLEFRFFRNGEKYHTISLGHVKDGKLYLTPENGERLMREFQAFFRQIPESIKSGRRLAEIMGAKARRIRDNVVIYLDDGGESSGELIKMYEMMKRMLVHDLDHAKFADMYAQTLVYGLFVARYGDSTPDNFTRSEARDLVPASNPFLRHFFDHIVGPNFDTRLGYIVDELCEVFSVSNVQEIVHKHLHIIDGSNDAKDPIIHFYEDFLQAYDPAERKRMGAYYTPTPVVQFIVRHIDRILREDFGIAQGLASTQTITRQVETGQDLRADRRRKAQTMQTLVEPRVQILDPAVGTATFLNETIKYIYEQNFKGKQDGMWPAYANDNLVPRLFGFELMMAPYTVAHLKLGMTLKETGVERLTNRLNVFLTNTLEEGVPQQPDLFSFGLAEAVSEESRLAAEVKSEKPVMVILGNPPYSVSSNNKSKFIENLVADYKKDLNERNIQPLSDDYIKFVRFAEDMIARNGSGVVGMITNNSYIDGIIHRQMRKHLLQTFDKIYVLDLHGNSKKKEVAPDGTPDVNVFDIQQGVSIVLMVKNGERQGELGQVYHADLYGKRQAKFDELQAEKLAFTPISATAPSYYFVPKSIGLQEVYSSFIPIADLYISATSGVVGGRDGINVQLDPDFTQKIDDFRTLSQDELSEKYKTANSRDWTIASAKNDISKNQHTVYTLAYKPMDSRFSLYTGMSKGFVQYPRQQFWHDYQQDNVGLNLMRKIIPAEIFSHVFVSDSIIDKNYYGFQSYTFPLYRYHENNTRTPNLNPTELSALMRNIPNFRLLGDDEASAKEGVATPEDILDYIYAVLHSPSYREKYKEFLKIDFPRIPPPANYDEFARLVTFGAELRELHLMQADIFYNTTYPVAGDNLVDKITWTPDQVRSDEHGESTARHSGLDPESRQQTGRVYINATQYFGNVPHTAWEFYIGGYQPAQKWLKDRRGRQLTHSDIDHYQRIIKVLLETHRIMQKIG